MKTSKWQTTPLVAYEALRTYIGKNPRSDQVTEVLNVLGISSLNYLSNLNRKALVSLVPQKSYFSFSDGAAVSRAVNESLFQDGEHITKFLAGVKANDLSQLTSLDITKACYTLTMSFACVVDLLNPRDQKTPATYYEYLIIHLITKTLKSDRAEQVRVKISDNEEIHLTLDLVLDLGNGKPKFHIAIKNSTRERGTEMWAHQRILDAAHPGKYVGLFFGLAETKLDHNSFEVVEICVPHQWRVYQQYIAKLDRIYFADPPVQYLQLNNITPFIPVRPIGDFFFDYESLSDLIPSS